MESSLRWFWTRLRSWPAIALAFDEVLAVAEETFGNRLDPAVRFFVEEIFHKAA